MGPGTAGFTVSSGEPWILAQCGTLSTQTETSLSSLWLSTPLSVPFIKLVGGKIIFCGFAMAYESLFPEMGLCQLCWKEGVVEFKAR